jgi:DNA modification methylase
MGSCTTAKASIQLERNWLGSEIDSEYCDICNKRLSSVPVEITIIGEIVTKESLKK